VSIRIQNALRHGAPDVKGGTFSVLLAIADIANKEGVCWPGIDYIAELAHVSPSTVDRAIKKLTNLGYLFVDTGRGRNCSSTYRINTSLCCFIEDEKNVILQEKTSDCGVIEPEKKRHSARKNVILQRKNVNMTYKPSLTTSNQERVKDLTAHAHTREEEPQPEPAPVLGLRDFIKSKARTEGNLYQTLYSAACEVLDAKALTAAQQKKIAVLYDQYGADPRMDAALVEFATEKCADKNIKDLRYWRTIITERLDNPEWPGMEHERRQLAVRKEQINGNGTGHHPKPGYVANDRNARGNRAVEDWVRTKQSVLAPRHDIQELPPRKPGSP
jgi:DNA-binding transcriptional regulator YhcF (GntR family)